MGNKYFIDTEFLEGTQDKRFLGIKYGETKPTIDLISIGIVSDDDRPYYYEVSKDFNLKEAWNRYDLKINKHYPLGPEYEKEYWIRDNVLKPIFRRWYGVHNNIDPTVFDHLFTYKEFKRLLEKHGKTNKEIAVEIKEFTKVIDRDKFDNSFVTGVKPEFYAYYGAYDWVVFCWIFGKMIDLPDGFPMYVKDLKQEMDRIVTKSWKDVEMSTWGHTGIEDIKKLPGYPQQNNEHDAIQDAMWNKKLYEFLKTL